MVKYTLNWHTVSLTLALGLCAAILLGVVGCATPGVEIKCSHRPVSSINQFADAVRTCIEEKTR